MRFLSLDEARKLLRNAAVGGSHVSLVTKGTSVKLSIGSKVRGLISETPKPMLVVGCDLQNYSGLFDLQQYLFGGLLPILVRRTMRYVGNDGEIFAISGTGDGALIALKTTDPWAAVLFAARLWLQGKKCAFSQGLRTALGIGTCLDGAEFGGVAQLQGHGLIETARVMNCDKGRHVLVALGVWDILAARSNLAAEGKAAGRVVLLRRSRTIFEGKSKQGDLSPTRFVNCFGSVRESMRKGWRFGISREDRLEHPGQKGKPRRPRAF